MAAISTTCCVSPPSAFKTRSVKKLPGAFQGVFCKFKVECSSSREHSDLSRRSLSFIDSGLHSMENGSSNVRRGLREEDSCTGGQVQAMTGSECDAPTTLRTIARLLDRSTKWILATGALSALVWRHDSPEVVWATTGCVLNALSSKSLKHLFNQPRPASAVGLKTDGGMPSSHAQNLGYLTTSTLFLLIGWHGLNTFTLGVAFAIITWAACMTWLRVLEGFHTYSQVIAGALIGFIIALSWFWLWKSMMLKILTSTRKTFLLIIFQLFYIFLGLIVLLPDLA